MSLSTVMKPHMKNSVVTIANARKFLDGLATAADVSDARDIRILASTPYSNVTCGKNQHSIPVRTTWL
jgi:hypothetical protein